MGYYALVKDNVVFSVIVADQAFIDATPLAALSADMTAEVFEDRPGPGHTYDPITGLFTPPVVPE